MDLDRPHRTTSTPTTTSELFICFTSRLSHSSSMRLSTKSILSPGRAAASGGEKSSSSSSLTTSLSRRLRHNGSLRGAQSPAMFPTKKNRGSSAFNENPEPSSPKVTCIGQVRVKTKKQGKKMKMRACRSKRISGGESSFRRIETQESTHQSSSSSGHGIQGNNHNINSNSNNHNQQQQQQQECSLPHRNQRWVHLPLTICEALRTFGNEFSCLLPCKSSCFSNNGREKGGEKGEEGKESGVSSCGAVFRWLVAMQEGEGEEGKRRDIELVVGGDEEEERERERERERGRVMERECSRRRSIFDDMEFDDLFDGKNVKDNNGENESNGDEEKARVSVCVPPKNALLLMRCRSDPMRMASLSQKFWEAPVVQDDDDDDEEQVSEAKDDQKTELVEEKSEVREEVLEEVVQESEKLDEGIEEIDRMCEDLEVVEPNVEDLAVSADEQVEKQEKIKEEEVVQMEDEEEQETGEIQRLESNGEAEQQIDESTEETQVVEYENLANGSSIESITEERENLAKNNVHEQEEVQDSANNNAHELENVPDLAKNNLDEQEDMQDLAKKNANEQENVQDLTTNNAQNQESEQDLAKNNAQNQENEQYLATAKRAETESSDLSSSNSTSSSSAASEESTAESIGKESSEEKDLNVEEENKDEARKTIEKESKFGEKLQEKNNKPMLPDCLLLMMCEPKLSMEVSKETWVCSTDFIRWLPERHHSKKPTKAADGSDESSTKKKKAAALAPLPPQPPAQPGIQQGRSSISFPAGGSSVANLIEQKLANAGVGYEPFVLTRCKSAPIRSTAKIAAPELACSLWGRENGRKLEPHRPATCGVGAAGVGF